MLDLNLSDLIMKDGRKVDLVSALNQDSSDNQRCIDFFSQDDQDIQWVKITIVKSRK